MMDRVDDKPGSAEEGVTVHEWIRRLQAGAATVRNIPREAQVQIVEYLTSEGYSRPDIGGVLGVHERTVARLRSEGRRANALRVDPDFPDVMAGELVRVAETEVQRIRKSLRDKELSPEGRISGSLACWTIFQGLVTSLQKLGRLPSAATEVRGELVHHVQHDMTAPAALIQEWERIRGIVQSSPDQDPESLARLDALGREVRALGVVEQIQAIPLLPEAEQKEEPRG